MKISRGFVLLTVLTLILVYDPSQAAEDSTALLRINLSRNLSWSELIERNIDILAVYPDGTADIAVNEEQKAWLDTRTFDYRILERRMLRAASQLDADLGEYHTYAETEAAIDSLATLFPTLTRVDTLGTSVEGRLIRGIKISDNAAIDEEETEVLIIGCHHARELMSVEVPLLFAEYLLDNYGTSTQVTTLVDEREIWIVPILNPDGHVYVQNNHSGDWWTWWRKNRRDNGDGTFGVDLNRNYGFMWGYDDEGSSPETSSLVYRGPSPFSEPETQAMRDFCAGRSFSVALSYHSYSELIIYPWAYDAIYTEDHEFFSIFADSLQRGNGYSAGCTATNILYPTNGEFDDWMYGETSQKNRIYSYTIELNSYEEGGFAPPDSLIQPTFDKVLELNLTLLRRAEEPFSVKGPLAPLLGEAEPLANPDYMLNWSGQEAGGPNIPAGYRITEYRELEGISDPVEAGDTLWIKDGFTITSSRAASGSYSYYSGSGDGLDNTLQMATVFPAVIADTLNCKLWYDIETDWDYAYLEASLDQGLTWLTVPGDRTTDSNPNGNNSGNGITGFSGGWVAARFYLEDIPGIDPGAALYLRFSYITDSYVTEEGIYLDDLDPVASSQGKKVLAEAVTDTFYIVRPDLTGEFAYQVSAYDSEDHHSRESNLVFQTVSDLTDDQLTPHYKTALNQNYPNPFNPSTTIRFQVGTAGSVGNSSGKAGVNLSVYDAEGRKVSTLLDRFLAPGEYSARWSGRNSGGKSMASGIYFLRLTVGEKAFSKKIVLLR